MFTSASIYSSLFILIIVTTLCHVPSSSLSSSSSFLNTILLVSASPSPSSSSSSSTSCTFQTQRVQCGSLSCNSTTHQCVPCTASSQCYNPAMVCLPTESGDADNDQQCQVMDVGSLMTARPVGFIAAIVSAIISLTVGVIGGAGAGAIITVFYQIFLGVPFTEAVALSQATIAGQSSFNMFILMRRHHPNYQPPKPTRPIINYTLIAFWLPITLAGTAIGNLLGHIFADWHRVVLLLLLLSYALKRLIDKMMKQKKEDEAKRAEEERRMVVSRNDDQDDDSDDDEEGNHAHSGGSLINDEKESRVSTKPKAPKEVLDQIKRKARTAQEVDSALIMMSGSRNASSSLSSNGNMAMTVELELQEKNGSSSTSSSHNTIVDDGASLNVDHNDADKSVDRNPDGEEETATVEPSAPSNQEAVPQFPRLQITIMFATFLPLLLANLVKNRFAECGSAGFWLLTVGSILYNLAVAFMYRKYLAGLNQKIALGEADSELIPFKWNNKITIVFPLISSLAGLGASATGIGGGVVLSFLLVEAGLVPEEVSATGGFATFAVSIEALLQFIIQGSIRLDYFGIFFVAGLCATSLGQLVLMPEIKRRGWRFLILGCLGIVMLGSMLSVSIFGIVETVELVQANANVGFGSLCHHKAKVHTADSNA